MINHKSYIHNVYYVCKKITDLCSAFSLFLLMIKKFVTSNKIIHIHLYDLCLKNKISEKKKNLTVSSQFNFFFVASSL